MAQTPVIIYKFMNRDNANADFCVEHYLDKKLRMKQPQRKNYTIANMDMLLKHYNKANISIDHDMFTLSRIKSQADAVAIYVNDPHVRVNPEAFAFFATLYTMYLNPKLLMNIYIPFMRELLEHKLLDVFGDEFKHTVTILFPENAEEKASEISSLTQSNEEHE